MAYIGSTPESQGFTPGIDYFNGNGSTLAFTLSRNVTSVYQVEVVVNNVIQNPSSAYTVLNNTITFTSAPLTGTNNIYVQYVTLNSSLAQPGAGTVETPQLGNVNTISSATTLTLKTNSGVTAVTIDASQNVGIGTSSPATWGKFAVVGASSGGQVVASIANTSGTANTQAVLSFDTTNNGFNVRDSQIRATNSGGNATTLEFYTANAATPAERMRINSSGNVGIGTSSPQAKLQVTDSAHSCQMFIGYTDNNNYYQSNGAQIWSTYNGTAERMRIDSSGNVGIGTSSPTQKLQVAGSQILSSPGNAVYTYFDSTTAAYVGREAVAGAMVFGVNSAERMRIDSSGNLLVGTTGYAAGQNAVKLNGASSNFSRNSTAASAQIYFENPNGTVGQISSTGSATAYITSSDYRLKENIAPMTGALDKVALLKPVTYKWKVDGSDGQGFIAHELQAVVHECVIGEKDAVNEDGTIKPQGIDTSFLVATLTAAIQEQQTLIEALTARLTALEAK